MGTGPLPTAVLSDRDPPARRPRLIVAGVDLPRAEGLLQDLSALGYDCRAEEIREEPEIAEDVQAVILDLRSWVAEGVSWTQRGRQEGWLPQPVVPVLESAQLPQLSYDLFDDFIEDPYTLAGLGARLRLARWRSQRDQPDVLAVKDLVVEPESYRATLRGTLIELTFMEFELLKFLMSHPGRVFTRETLLSRVWGYEYYGGVRTVDVHIRRLRAKLGDDHARFIETVRGVGYRFSQA
ncbi:MAG TPA: response regulator transcription factor [Actinomycetota bacterium]|nr:response regulator transcription factor [Actinomycetota bacterium]